MPSHIGTQPVQTASPKHVQAAISPYCTANFNQKLRGRSQSWCLASGTTVSVLPEDPLLPSVVSIAIILNVHYCCAEHANEENYDQVYNQPHEGSMTHEALGGELQAPSIVRYVHHRLSDRSNESRKRSPFLECRRRRFCCNA